MADLSVEERLEALEARWRIPVVQQDGGAASDRSWASGIFGARESEAERRLAALEAKLGPLDQLEARLAPLEERERAAASAEAEAAEAAAARAAAIASGDEDKALAAEAHDEAALAELPSTEEDRERMRDELNENFAGAIESYYGLVQAKLLWARYSNVAAWRVCLHFCSATSLIFMTLVALHSVKDFTELIAEWDDDELFGMGNRNQYTYFHHVYDQIYWVALPTAFTLVLCSFVVGLTLAEKIRDMIATYMLICRQVYGSGGGTGAGAWMPPPAALAALFLHQMRVCLVVQFVVATSVLIGTGDGAFNVMLNSLAVSFLLDVDDQIVSCMTAFMPSPTRGPHLSKLWEPKVNYLVTKPEKHYNLLAGAHYGIMVGALVVVVVNSWTMQTRTSWGERFNLDGDMLLNPRYSASEVNNYTTVVTSATWAFLMFFSFSCSVLVGMCTHGASVRTVVQATVFEGALVFALYNGLIFYAIGDGIMGWKKPGVLAECGDDCAANYGGGWADGA